METLNLDKKLHYIGSVRQVDTRKVTIFVDKDENLLRAKVGHLMAIKLPGTIEEWSICIIENVIKAATTSVPLSNSEIEETPNSVLNTVKATILGELNYDADYINFSRSISRIPEIDSKCYSLQDEPLTRFMNALTTKSDVNVSFRLGEYSLSSGAAAYIDGNKFFQRHAALVGSTGTGKSWTVAAILEKASKLTSSNLVVFDLHGEYRELDYAKHLRIPGPDELGSSEENLLYLPYWILNAEELQTMFIDRSEFTAHNQVMAFQDAVIEEKKELLSTLVKKEVLSAFTIDSPIPFTIDKIYTRLTLLNEEMVDGARGLKQGTFYGQFSRLLTRLRSKIQDKRYGFLFQSPKDANEYGSMAELVRKLMNFSDMNTQIKIIDFSEVPEDILPIIVGLVARIIYQIQFWTSQAERHPIVFVCDEAHLYISKKEGQNPVEKRAVENFEKIAKEGRKYGVALFIISQRPSDVSETILSQCNNVISLRLANSADQQAVKKFMPESLESLMESLPILEIGEAIVVGDSVLLPSRIKIDKPTQQPLSSTIDIWSEWAKDKKGLNFIQIVENLRRQSRKVNETS